jgi:hypothetical protein
MNNACSSRNLPVALFLKAKAPAYRHAGAATILWFAILFWNHPARIELPPATSWWILY